MTQSSVPVSENDIVHGRRNVSLDFFVLDTSAPRKGFISEKKEGREIDSGDAVSTLQPGKDLRVQLVSGIEVGVSLVDPSEYETRNRSCLSEHWIIRFASVNSERSRANS